MPTGQLQRTCLENRIRFDDAEHEADYEAARSDGARETLAKRRNGSAKRPWDLVANHRRLLQQDAVALW